MPDPLLEAAISSLGIYPKATIQDGVETPRDRYGDGWNDAIMELARRRVKLETWRAELPHKDTVNLYILFASELLEVHLDGDEIQLTINMNDVFVPAAVSEPIDLTDIDALTTLYVNHGSEGVIAWMSRRYTCAPRKGRVNEEVYAAALAEIASHSS